MAFKGAASIEVVALEIVLNRCDTDYNIHTTHYWGSFLGRHLLQVIPPDIMSGKRSHV